MSKFAQGLKLGAAIAALGVLAGCGASIGTIRKPLQNTPLKAPVTVVTGWVDDHAIDSPDTINEEMHQSAKLALSKTDVTALVQAGVSAGLQKHGITPTFVIAPTPYNQRFDMSPPPQLNQVKEGSVLVVGVRPELLCVASALERRNGTTDLSKLYPCSVVAIDVSVLHHAADGTVDPPLVWRETFKRDTTVRSRCRSVEACTQEGMDILMKTLKANNLF